MTEKTFKSDKYDNLYSDKKAIPLPTGRAVFVQLNKEHPLSHKYSINILYKKDDATALPLLKALKAEFMRVAAEKWSTDYKTKKFLCPAVLDGDVQRTSKENDSPIGETYECFKGCFYIRAGNKNKVLVVDVNGKPIDPSVIVPGMLVDGHVDLKAITDGCSLTLNIVRLVKDDGVRIYTGADPVKMLRPLAPEGEEDTPLESAADDALGESEEEVEEKPKKVTKKSAKEVAADNL